jgi:hypothetical protein
MGFMMLTPGLARWIGAKEETAAVAAYGTAGEPLEHWKALLHWAARSPFHMNHRSMLADLMRRGSVAGIQSQLLKMPTTPLAFFAENAHVFRSGHKGAPPSQPCSTFWETEARIALVQPWYRAEAPARTFDLDAAAIGRFAPDVLVASPSVLAKLASTGLESPKRGIVAVHAPGMAMMREADRTALWTRFQVPVYQQLRGFQGELLAAECDAQTGFHAHEAVAYWEVQQQQLIYTNLVNLRHPVLRLATGWFGDLEKSRCGCGAVSPRIFPFERQSMMRNCMAKGMGIELPETQQQHYARA